MSYKPRWLNDNEQEMWRLLLAAFRKIDRGTDETLQAGADISSSEFAVLVSLSEADEKAMRLRDLCADLDWDRSRASHQITRMEKRGLVEKKRCARDGRGVLIALTDAGREKQVQAAPAHVESVRRLVFDHLPAEDIPVLKEFFSGVVEVDNLPGYDGYEPNEHLSVKPK